MYMLIAAACSLGYWLVCHMVLRMFGIRFPLTGLRRKDRVEMYRLGFLNYVVFVWIIEYGVGIFIFASIAQYLRQGAVSISDIFENLFVWLVTGVVMGVSSYKHAAEG